MPSADIRSTDDIEAFVEAFYNKLLNDARLAPIFLDVADIDLRAHQPLIVSYWEKLLLGGSDYQRHTLRIHRQLHQKQALQPCDFDRWLEYFRSTMDGLYSGPTAERAKRIATTIAANMQGSLPH